MNTPAWRESTKSAFGELVKGRDIECCDHARWSGGGNVTWEKMSFERAARMLLSIRSGADTVLAELREGTPVVRIKGLAVRLS